MLFNLFIILAYIFSIFFYYRFIEGRKFDASETLRLLANKKAIAVIAIFLIITGLVKFSLKVQIGQYLIIFLITYLCSLVDIKSRIIPNTLLIAGFAMELLQIIIFRNISYFDALKGMMLGLLIFLVISVISKGGLGMGDVKLMALCGFSLGSGGAIKCIVFSILISGIVSAILILAREISPKDTIPFAPFIFLGAVISAAI